MKFALASDLHLDFGGLDILPTKCDGVDVLVLAGDIIEVNVLKENSNKTQRIVEYLRKLNDSFSHVLYVCGNHEHYGNSFAHTVPNLRTQFKRHGLTNFKLLERETVEIGDTIFFGATMWTSFRNGNPSIMAFCANYMNDYSQIHVASKDYYKEKLQPEHTAAICVATKKKLVEFASLVTDKKKVLITHMAPCHLSLGDKRLSDSNHAYYEDITEILMDSDIKVAVHGHIHDPVCYTVGDTYIVSNPRGYFGSEPQSECFAFEVVNV